MRIKIKSIQELTVHIEFKISTKILNCRVQKPRTRSNRLASGLHTLKLVDFTQWHLISFGQTYCGV